MIANKNIEKYLWISAVTFTTFLFLGSFLSSKDYFDLIYLLILYGFICSIKLFGKE